MFHFRFRAIILTTLIAIFSPQCFAGDKEVKFETIPSGAQVELDGSIVCTTPCSIHLPSYYFKLQAHRIQQTLEDAASAFVS